MPGRRQRQLAISPRMAVTMKIIGGIRTLRGGAFGGVLAAVLPEVVRFGQDGDPSRGIGIGYSFRFQTIHPR